MKKFKKLGYIKSYNEKDHTFTAIVSAKTVDRDGDVILPSAFASRIDDFMKNPVMQWAHQYGRPPIGKWLAYRITEDEVEMDGKFAVEESEFAAEIARLYAGGYLNAFSVGFMGHEYSEDAILEGQRGLTFTGVELLEVSCVPVPSNREALGKHMSAAGEALHAIMATGDSKTMDLDWELGDKERVCKYSLTIGAENLDLSDEAAKKAEQEKAVEEILNRIKEANTEGTEGFDWNSYKQILAQAVESMETMGEAEIKVMQDLSLEMAKLFGLKVSVEVTDDDCDEGELEELLKDLKQVGKGISQVAG